MHRVLLFVISLFIGCWSPLAAAEISFPTWLVDQANDRIENLKKENGSLSDEDIKRTLQRAKEAFHAKNWAAASSEYARLLGRFPENHDYWSQYGLALQHQNAAKSDWRTEQEAKIAAMQAFNLSKTAEEKALALLLFGSLLSPDNTWDSPSYIEIYTAANGYFNLAELRKKHPQYAHFMLFKFMNTRVNNQNTPPSACFAFSHKLKSKEIQYLDYITVKPAVDGHWIVNDREICLSPLKFGGSYEITFKAGLPDEMGEKLTSTETFNLVVKDQSTRLSFTNKAYILLKEDKAIIPLTGVNVDAVKLQVYRIDDRAFNVLDGNGLELMTPIFWEYQADQIRDKKGELLWQGEMDFTKERNKTVTKQVPFSEVVKNVKPGIYIVQAEEKNVLFTEKARATQWVIVSDMGLTTFTSLEGGITVSVRSLSTAETKANKEIQLLAYNNTILGKVKTNKEGIAQFDANLTRGSGGNRPMMVLAYDDKKNDFSFLDLRQPAFDLSDRGVKGRSVSQPLDAFLYTEQGVYRPGSTVHVNAMLRNAMGIAMGEVPLTFKLSRPDLLEVSEQTLVGNKLGFYELSLPLISSAKTGLWTILAYSDPKKDPIGRASFLVEDFVPSRILVSLKTKDTAIIPKEPVSIEVEGNFLYGTKAAGLEGKAFLTLKPNNNPFPQFPGFSFGLIDEQFTDVRIDLPFEPLDKEGKEVLKVVLEKTPETTKPLEGVVKVTLADKGGRPEIGTLKLPVFLSDYTVGIKPKFQNNLVQDSDSEAVFQIIALDNQGHFKSISNLEYELFKEDLNFTWYQSFASSPWQYQTVVDSKLQSNGTVNTIDAGPIELKLALQDWGQYRLVVRDPKTKAATSIRFNKGWMTASSNAETPDRLVLKINKESYKLGETVEVSIESPFDGEALLTIANDKVIETRNISVSKKGTVVKLKAEASWQNGSYCMVSAFRPLGSQYAKEKPFLPKRAIGIAWIGIETKPKTLTVSFTPPKEVRPRQIIELPLEVKDGNNKAVSSDTIVSIAAVDEGILKLTDFATPNPQDYFFGQRYLGLDVNDVYGRLIDPIEGPLGVLRTGGDMGALSRNLQGLSKRSFKVISLYSGVVSLDKEGKGKVSISLPDFNGTLRLMAVALNKDQVGNGEAEILVRDPVIIEGTLPRFLALNDEAQFNVSFTNVSQKPDDFSISVVAEGSLELKGENNFKLQLDNHAVQAKTIAIKANKIGDGLLKVHLQGKDINLSQTFELSVRPAAPYVNRLENTLLKSNETATLNKELLDAFIKDTVLVSATWSSRVPWDVNALSKKLARYGYNCIEQIISKGFGTEKTEAINQAVAILTEKQAGNGSFYLWSESSEPGDMWLTAYALDFLQSVREKNHAIPKFTFSRGLEWLSQRVKNVQNNQAALAGASYGLYVLTKENKIDTGSLRYFFDMYYETLLDPLSRTFISAALAEKGDLVRANKGFANAYQGTSEVGPYGSTLRNDAAILFLMSETLNRVPALKELASLSETLVNSLGNQLKVELDRLSTQEEAWAIRAANMRNNSQDTIQVMVNNQTYTSMGSILNVPISVGALLEKSVNIQNQGQGSLWQNIAISGIPANPLEAESKGLEITRTYYDRQGNPVSLEKVQQGTELMVVLEGNSTQPRAQQLLVVDLLPAGFEIENARLEEGENLSKPSYTEARDDRFVAALSLDKNMPTFKLVYSVRAVTPGQYIHPGVFVEDMYSPQYYARTKESKVEILAP